MTDGIEHYAQQRKEDILLALARGVPPDYPAYKQLVGAFEEVERLIAELDDRRRRALTGEDDPDEE